MEDSKLMHTTRDYPIFFCSSGRNLLWVSEASNQETSCDSVYTPTTLWGLAVLWAGRNKVPIDLIDGTWSHHRIVEFWRLESAHGDVEKWAVGFREVPCSSPLQQRRTHFLRWKTRARSGEELGPVPEGMWSRWSRPDYAPPMRTNRAKLEKHLYLNRVQLSSRRFSL